MKTILERALSPILCLSLATTTLAVEPPVRLSALAQGGEGGGGGGYNVALQRFTVVAPAGTAGDSPGGDPDGVPESLYGVEVTLDQLLLLNKATATSALIGPVSTPIPAGLVFDPETGWLYATDTLTANLVSIDPLDGSTTVIGNTGVFLLHGLAIHPGDGALYASNAGFDMPSNLYRIDKTTGTAELVGPTGFIDIGALDFDPTTGILYGARGGPTSAGMLITIDPSTGDGTFVAFTHRLNGLAFDNEGTLHGSENGLFSGAPSSLYVIDKFTGAWTLIGAIDPFADNVLGIDFEVEAEGGQVTLCHVPPGNPGNDHTISVGAPAVPAHLAHGDTLGPCEL